MMKPLRPEALEYAAMTLYRQMLEKLPDPPEYNREAFNAIMIPTIRSYLQYESYNKVPAIFIWPLLLIPAVTCILVAIVEFTLDADTREISIQVGIFGISVSAIFISLYLVSLLKTRMRRMRWMRWI